MITTPAVEVTKQPVTQIEMRRVLAGFERRMTLRVAVLMAGFVAALAIIPRL